MLSFTNLPTEIKLRPHPRFEVQALCANPACDNTARYDSGYCGLCDLELNAGRGRALRRRVAAGRVEGGRAT